MLKYFKKFWNSKFMNTGPKIPGGASSNIIHWLALRLLAIVIVVLLLVARELLR